MFELLLNQNFLVDPSSDELKRLMLTYGGGFDHYYSKTSTTFVVANNLAFGKISQLQPYEKVIKPEWILDSIKESRLMEVNEYLVYKPGQVEGQKTIAFPTTTREAEKVEQASNDFDIEFIESLPPDIRAEILQGLHNKQHQSATTSRPIQETSNKKSSNTSKAKGKNIVKPKVLVGPLDLLLRKKISSNDELGEGKPHICGESTFEGVSDLLKEWVQTEPG